MAEPGEAKGATLDGAGSTEGWGWNRDKGRGGMGWKRGWWWEWGGDRDSDGDRDGGGNGPGEQELSTPPPWLCTEVTLNAEVGTVGTEFFHPYSQLSGGD